MENELMADFPSSSNFSSSGSKKPQLLLFIATTDGQVAEVATLSLQFPPLVTIWHRPWAFLIRAENDLCIWYLKAIWRKHDDLKQSNKRVSISHEGVG